MRIGCPALDELAELSVSLPFCSLTPLCCLNELLFIDHPVQSVLAALRPPAAGRNPLLLVYAVLRSLLFSWCGRTTDVRLTGNMAGHSVYFWIRPRVLYLLVPQAQDRTVFIIRDNPKSATLAVHHQLSCRVSRLPPRNDFPSGVVTPAHSRD